MSTSVSVLGAPDELSAAAKLGKQPFFDESLSASGSLSCATCHDPKHAYGPANGLGVRLGGTSGPESKAVFPAVDRVIAGAVSALLQGASSLTKGGWVANEQVPVNSPQLAQNAGHGT